MAKDGAVYLTYADLPYVNADMTNIVDRGDRYVKEGVPDVDGSGTLHWSDDVRINNDATTTDQWNPSIAISPDGNTIFVGYCSLPSRPSRGDGQPVGCREQWCEDAVPMVSERGARPDGLIPGATNVVYEAKPASTTTYRVKITNQAGETVSAPATVTVVAHLPSLDFAWVAGKPVDTVHAAAGVTVQVERSEDPVAGPWTSVGEVVTTGDSVTLVNIAAPASDARFYRALVVRWHRVTRHSSVAIFAGSSRAWTCSAFPTCIMSVRPLWASHGGYGSTQTVEGFDGTTVIQRTAGGLASGSFIADSAFAIFSGLFFGDWNIRVDPHISVFDGK